jgi:hypothetical protein
MLMARQHFFTVDNLDLGFTDLEQHTIDLKDKDPLFSPQFGLPAEHLKLSQENVAGWLQAGIIERSRSPYNSPIFCVPKKEGQGLRCVLDYRRMNASERLAKAKLLDGNVSFFLLHGIYTRFQGFHAGDKCQRDFCGLAV